MITARALFAFLLLLFFSIPVCLAQDTIFFDKKWKPTKKTKAEFYRIQTKKDNKWFVEDYYKTKILQMRGSYSSLDPDIKDGEFAWYYPNGKASHTGKILNDRYQGEHRYYFESGQLELLAIYVNDTLNGPYEQFYSNGQLDFRTSMQNDLWHGPTVFMQENGLKRSEGNYKKDRRDGLWAFYDVNGDTSSTAEYLEEIIIPEADFSIQTPNDEWYLEEKSVGETTRYLLERGYKGNELDSFDPPSVLILVHDARIFNQSLFHYGNSKGLRFDFTPKIERVYSPNQKHYPLPYPNSYFVESTYTDLKKEEGKMIVACIITEDNIGIQIYLDTNKKLDKKFENELWQMLRSIKRLSK